MDKHEWLTQPDRQPIVLVEVSVLIGGQETLLRLANNTYATVATDTPPHTPYEVAVAGGVSLRETLDFLGDSSSPLGYGDIDLHNLDGSRDHWLLWVWANRRVTVLMGDQRWPRADFFPVFSGVVEDIDSKSRDRLSIKLRDGLQRLNAPVSEQQLGGTTDNKDRLLPLSFGCPFNVSPLLIAPSQHEYRVHDGAVAAIVEVRDNGSPVSITRNLTTGTFKLNNRPFGTITADVQHSLTKVADIIRLLATAYGKPSERFTGSEIDNDSFSQVATLCPQPVGVYLDDRRNVLEVCQDLAKSVGCALTVSREGKLKLIRLAAPSNPRWDIQPDDMIAGTLRIVDRPAVQAAVKVGYARNHTPQSSGMAGGIPAAHLDLHAAEWQHVTVDDAAIATRYRQHTEPEQLDTMLVRRIDAQTEATRRLGLLSKVRHVFEFAARSRLLDVTVGDTVKLSHPRFGLSVGKLGVVVDTRPNWLDRKTVLCVLVWDDVPVDVAASAAGSGWLNETVKTLQAAAVRMESVSLPVNVTVPPSQLQTGTLPAGVAVVPGTNFASLPAGLIAGTIQTSQLSASVITTNNLSAQSISANQITTGTLSADRLSASVITTNNLSAQSISANQITTGTLSASRLSSSVITTSNLSAQSISANQITTGTLSADRLSASVITTSNLSAQSISANQIKTGQLSASQIDSRGLLVKDSYGNVLFGAGYPLSAYQVSGLGSLALKNAISTGEISGLGSLATKNAVYANELLAGTLAAGVVYAGSIKANQITSGSISADRISGGSLTGVSITGTASIQIPGSLSAYTNYFRVATYADFASGLNIQGKLDINGSVRVSLGGIWSTTGKEYLKRGDSVTFYPTSGSPLSGTLQ